MCVLNESWPDVALQLCVQAAAAAHVPPGAVRAAVAGAAARIPAFSATGVVRHCCCIPLAYHPIRCPHLLLFAAQITVEDYLPVFMARVDAQQ
jgi:hypothetical protein